MNNSISNIKEAFNEKKYALIQNAIPNIMQGFFLVYLWQLQKNDKLQLGDQQVSDAYCVYGDPACDSLLYQLTPLVSKIIGIELLPTYSYARIYLHGAELLPHIDRDECEYSATISLGQDSDSLWPIWMKDEKNDPECIPLYPGDMCVYKGNEVYHWRDKFEGKSQYQLFLHWVDKNGDYKDNIYDSRPMLGLPFDSRK